MAWFIWELYFSWPHHSTFVDWDNYEPFQLITCKIRPLLILCPLLSYEGHFMQLIFKLLTSSMVANIPQVNVCETFISQDVGHEQIWRRTKFYPLIWLMLIWHKPTDYTVIWDNSIDDAMRICGKNNLQRLRWSQGTMKQIKYNMDFDSIPSLAKGENMPIRKCISLIRTFFHKMEESGKKKND